MPKFSYADATGGGGARGAPLFVPTVETTRLTYFLDSLMANRCAARACVNTTDSNVDASTDTSRHRPTVTTPLKNPTNPHQTPPPPERHYVMFVGNTGTGKTAVLMNKLRGLDPEATAACIINLNSFSDAPSLQLQMEQPLEKKSGVRYGPPGGRR